MLLILLTKNLDILQGALLLTQCPDFMSVCLLPLTLQVCLPAYLQLCVCLSACLSLCVYLTPPPSLFLYLTSLSLSLSMYLSLHISLFAYFSHLSMRLSICVFLSLPDSDSFAVSVFLYFFLPLSPSFLPFFPSLSSLFLFDINM